MFTDLQKLAEKFMDDIAELCEKRHQEMFNEPEGRDLMNLSSWPQAAGDSAEIPHLPLPMRQDHSQVPLNSSSLIMDNTTNALFCMNPRYFMVNGIFDHS